MDRLKITTFKSIRLGYYFLYFCREPLIKIQCRLASVSGLKILTATWLVVCELAIRV
jgi:hypothetical protein